MKDLTQKQRKVLDFIKAFYKKHSYAPSLAEIAAHFKWASVNASKQYVEVLVKKGFVVKDSRAHRNIVVL